jgi:RNA polymerase sigma-70 factor (ECF subfamily)
MRGIPKPGAGARTGESARPARGAVAPPDAAALLARIARGDEDALVALYATMGGLVHATCLRILGSPDLAMDATAEAFWRVWERADRYDAERWSAPAWILTLARRLAVDRLRSDRRHGAAVARMSQSEAGTETESVEDALLARRMVESGLARLSGSDRMLLEAAYFSGLSCADIASRDDVALGTVKSRMRAALARLRIALGARVP